MVLSAGAAVRGSLRQRGELGGYDRSDPADERSRDGFSHFDYARSIRHLRSGPGCRSMAIAERKRADGMSTGQAIDPRRYYEAVQGERGAQASQPPVCLYLEVTNRCNLLCTTCPRTY